MALRVVVAGLGPRGLDWARTARASTLVTLAGGVDPDPAVRERAANDPALHGVPIAPALESFTVDADAAIVATSAQHHATVTEQALARGLGALVEKPFTLDLRAAVRLVRTAETRGLPLLVAQNYRYMRAHRTVRSLLHEGVLGGLASVTCHYWRPSHVVNAGLSALDAAALWETGVHHLDALRHTLGRRVTGVAADVSQAPWTRGLRGTSVRVLLEFEGGVTGTYSASWDAPGHEFFEAGQQFYERITGERGTLHVLQRWIVLCLTGRLPRIVRRGRRTESEEAALLRQLAAACAGGAAPDCSGRDNLQTLALLDACEQSWRRRQWINPQELLDGANAEI